MGIDANAFKGRLGQTECVGLLKSGSSTFMVPNINRFGSHQ
jgi:hypothetical protein